MALDSRAHPHVNNNTSFYTFGGSSSSANHQADLREEELSLSQVGFHKLTKSSNNHYLKLHQLSHMMHGGSGKVLSDSNDGSSLLSFEDSTEAAAGGHGYENDSECLNNSHQTASSFDSHLLVGDNTNHLKGKVNNRDDMSLDWFYSSDAAHDHAGAVHKHQPITYESYMPPTKKQCTSTTATPKKTKQAKHAVVSKDPQSIAAKNRRERISERLKILQELVPNGTKVDLVTMLEKAIGYVKFLQLQVKVLAADEFWPVQGGKAPELSQVKDAIDAILSSQRSDRNSASDL